MKMLLLLLFISQRVFAQSAFVPDRDPIPRPNYFESLNATDITDSALPEILKQSFLRHQNVAKQSCDSASSADYALSLTIKGNYAGCSQFVADCLKRKTNLPPALIIQGARCAALDFEYAKAFSFFNRGLKNRALKAPLNQAYYFEMAMLAQYSIYSDKTKAILALNTAWTPEQLNLALGFVELAGQTQPTLVSKADVFAFVEKQMSGASGAYLQFLKNWRINLYYQEYQIQKAYELLNADAAALDNPLDWWNTGFNVLYKMRSDSAFTVARSFYQAFLPFTHARSALPKENNVFTYSELHNGECANSLLQGADALDIKNNLNNWKNGLTPLNDLLLIFAKKPQSYFSKSDFLSTYAGLLVIAAQPDLAQKYYWQAHQLCAYNNRAHWGLVLLQRQKKYKAYPEFKANEARVDETLKNISFPPETKDYFSNWASLPATSQNRVKYASRIWAPFLKALNNFGSHSYIKPPFELLSLTPGLEELSDLRITYPFDFRLWDDVRGAGGLTVAADHDEVFMSVHGDYNLLGHEMAHQFHNYVSSVEPRLNDCIEKLYAAASARDLFPDGYSKSNVKEYFAQGVTYYLVPATSPVRYGVNSSWLPKNDPDLNKFIVSIDQSAGDLSKIICPL